MGSLGKYSNRLHLLAVMLIVSACVPKKNSVGSGGSESSETDSLAITTVRIGPGSAFFAEIYNGDYYSAHASVVISGTCKGNVKKILVEDTPQAGATTSQTVTCSNGSFNWSKTYGTQTAYSWVLTPQDTNNTTLSSIAPISKNYTYDGTNPTAPTFVTPSMTNNYTITNGVTNITIAGQVLNEVVKMVGPYSINLPLMVDGDGIHKNFMYSATVPLSSSVNFAFTGSDAAGNSATSTMTIDSVLNLSIPVAAQEIGGSHVATGNIRIESTVGFMSEVIINNNVKQVTGSAGILGNL
jgi:hypothetical protein